MMLDNTCDEDWMFIQYHKTGEEGEPDHIDCRYDICLFPSLFLLVHGHAHCLPCIQEVSRPRLAPGSQAVITGIYVH